MAALRSRHWSAWSLGVSRHAPVPFRCGSLPTLPPIKRGFQLSSNTVHRPSRLEEDFKSQQKLEFDRWQTAVTIVKRLREAGISCELFQKCSLTACALLPLSVRPADHMKLHLRRSSLN